MISLAVLHQCHYDNLPATTVEIAMMPVKTVDALMDWQVEIAAMACNDMLLAKWAKITLKVSYV